jgi:hypothetical protein
MKRAYATLRRTIPGAVVAAVFAIAGLSASAQEPMTTASPPTSKKKAPRTSATPEMIADAIERSKSRTERLRTLRIPEQFGSEDPARFGTK